MLLRRRGDHRRLVFQPAGIERVEPGIDYQRVPFVRRLRVALQRVVTRVRLASADKGGAGDGVFLEPEDHAVGPLLDREVVRVAEDVRDGGGHAVVHRRQRFVDRLAQGDAARVQRQRRWIRCHRARALPDAGQVRRRLCLER